MKLICQYSGIHYECNEFTQLSLHYEAIHPIFYLDYKNLNRIYKNHFLRNKLDNNEIKLLSLALLNCTDRVHFNNPVNFMEYSIKTALKIIPRIIDIIEIIQHSGLSSNRIDDTFPYIIISQDNNNLDGDNFIEAIQIWNDNYNESAYICKIPVKPIKSIRNNSKLDALNTALSRKYKKPRPFFIKLSEYIIESLDIPNNSILDINGDNSKKITLKDYYKYIIQYSGNVDKDIFPYLYSINIDAINNLIELIQTQLEFDNTFVFYSLELLNGLINTGIYNRYGMNIIQNSNPSNSSNRIPTPNRNDYKTYNDYFLAYTQYLASINKTGL